MYIGGRGALGGRSEVVIVVMVGVGVAVAVAVAVG